MQNIKSHQSILVEIEGAYADFSNNCEQFVEKKDHLITKIKQLAEVQHQKECLGAMLLACLESYFKAEKNCLSSDRLGVLKSTSIHQIQEFLNVFSELTKESSQGFELKTSKTIKKKVSNEREVFTQ